MASPADKSYWRIDFSLRLSHCLAELHGGLKPAARWRQSHPNTHTRKVSIDWRLLQKNPALEEARARSRALLDSGPS